MPVPFIAGGVITALGVSVGYLALRVLSSIGFAIVTYTSVNALLDLAINTIISQINSLPSELVPIIDTLNIVSAFGLVFSGITVRLTLGGLIRGNLKKLVFRGRA